MGICASCLGLGRRSASSNSDESASLLRHQADPRNPYGSTAALNARAGLDHLSRAGAAGSPPRRRIRDPAFERKERDAQERIFAETNARFIDVSWQPVGAAISGDETIDTLSQQESAPEASGSGLEDAARPRTQTLFAPDYVVRFRETFGDVPAFANMQAGKMMDERPDWFTQLVQNSNKSSSKDWDPHNVTIPQEVNGKFVMNAEDFLGEAGATTELISPAA